MLLGAVVGGFSFFILFTKSCSLDGLCCLTGEIIDTICISFVGVLFVAVFSIFLAGGLVGFFSPFVPRGAMSVSRY
jgi:hypothetical protein